MKKYDWKNEYNPIRRTAKRLLSGEALTDGRPLSDLIELDEHTRKCLAFEATLTDRQIDMLQELGYLPVIMRQYGEECANCPYTLDEREHGICRRCAVNGAGTEDCLCTRRYHAGHAVRPAGPHPGHRAGHWLAGR